MESQLEVLVDSSCWNAPAPTTSKSSPTDEEEKLDALSRSLNWPVIHSIPSSLLVLSAGFRAPGHPVSDAFVAIIARPPEAGVGASCMAGRAGSWYGSRLVSRFRSPASGLGRD